MEPILVDKERLRSITNLIIEIASGNFDAKLDISPNKDDLDAIITGINMVAQELRHSVVSRDYLESVYESIIDMVFIMDRDYNLVEVNRAVSETLGYTNEFVEGKPFSLVYDPGQAHVVEDMKKNLEESGQAYDLELNVVSSLAESIPVSCSASLLRDMNGDANGVLMIAKDITPLKKTQNKLLDKNTELKEFSHKVSHDIKSPLNSMLAITQAVDENTPEKDLREYFEYIREMAGRLKHTVDDLLEVSENAGEPLKWEVIDVNQLVEDLRKTHLSESISGRNNQFRITTENNLSQAFYSDYRLLYQVLNNLIENAIKYHDPEKEEDSFLRIRAEEQEGKVLLILEDNGVGISQDRQEQVFEKYGRGQEDSSGSGLGLHYVKNNLKRLGGDIWFSSKPGEGTTFKISLPRQGAGTGEV